MMTEVGLSLRRFLMQREGGHPGGIDAGDIRLPEPRSGTSLPPGRRLSLIIGLSWQRGGQVQHLALRIVTWSHVYVALWY